ncbi:MAG: ATP-grasp fold amidoligase family protein [Eubacteriales bacterium]|nr:ATP-grasp fold amidoligase family protein [Eubacteriales bacterium]
MPSLNVAPYIRECIESAIHQTMKEIEIICVDAGSTDGTLEILEEYARKDPRIRVLKSPVKSYGHQMNMGLDAARGEYFAILETDDCIKPNMFEELYQLAKDNYLDIIKSDFQLFVTDENNKKHFKHRPVISNRALLKYNVIYDPARNMDAFRSLNNIWNGIYDLGFLKANRIRFNESPGASYQDNGFWFLTMCHAHRIVFLDRSYYMLRRDNPNSSVHSRGKAFCMCDEYDYIRGQLSREPAIEKQFAPVLTLYRFKNYEWNYERIGDEFKDVFLERFSQDFRKLMTAGEIHGEYFNMEESFRLRMILDVPQAYKYHRMAVENREKTALPKTVSGLMSKIRQSMNSSHSSRFSKIGRIFTKLSGKIRGGIKCLADNGWRYTFKRTLVHLGLVKENTPRGYSKKTVSFPSEHDHPAAPKSNSILARFFKKIRGGVRCLEEHGLRYTFRRLLVHLRLVPDNTVNKKAAKNGGKPTVPSKYDYYLSLDRNEYRAELVKWYEDRTKSHVNLDYPKTYNEKIQWMKLYDSTPLKTRLSDKYLVRQFVADTIGEEYLVPLLGVWDSFDAIDFSQLPQKFVLKTNHGCATNIIVTDKDALDRAAAKKKMDDWLKTNYAFKNGFELQYMNIPPKIIAETYLENGGGDLKDYKVFCFNGKADCIMYLSDRKTGLRMAFYDLDWNKLDFTYSFPRIEEEIPKPDKLSEMVSLAEKLAAGFAHVRVDFYVLNDGSIKFGELTFTSASGACTWSDAAVNRRFGEMITLPIKSPIPEYEGYDRMKLQMLGIIS